MQKSDDIETKKDYLRSFMQYKRRAESLEEQLREIGLNQVAPGIHYSDMPKGSGSNADISNYIVRCDEVLSEILRAKRDYMVKYLEVFRAVNALENTEHQEILTLRYLQNCSWTKIEKKMSYARTTIWRLHGEALKEFQIPENAIKTESDSA